MLKKAAFPEKNSRLRWLPFGNYDFILKNLRYTAVRSNGIESYELYWILSLIDYYEYSGDTAGTKDASLRSDGAP